MSNFLETEILNKFLENIKNDQTIPNSLTEVISNLNAENKISKATHLKKLLEDFTPTEEVNDENK